MTMKWLMEYFIINSDCFCSNPEIQIKSFSLEIHVSTHLWASSQPPLWDVWVYFCRSQQPRPEPPDRNSLHPEASPESACGRHAQQTYSITNSHSHYTMCFNCKVNFASAKSWYKHATDTVDTVLLYTIKYMNPQLCTYLQVCSKLVNNYNKV